MKRFITILISCSLALAASAMAQQPEETANPKKEKAEKSQPANEVKPAPKVKEHAETKAPGYNKGVTESTATTPKPQAETKVKGKGKEPANAEATATGEQGVKGKKEHGAHTESATATNAASPSATVNAPIEKGKKGRNAHTGAATENKTASPAPTVAATTTTNQPNAQGGNKLNAQAKKPDPQTIQKIKTEHASFHAQPKPDKVPAVTFSESYRISGSEQWQGPQYEVFRSYHPERHDRVWYSSHYTRIELIGGGYYFWNNGYWYPAWGYSPSAQYYAYDGPIYVGQHAEPPDKVIADVQDVLQQMGYYKGEVDGLLGPLTREALTAYQADQGLAQTAAIDEPTLDSLGMS